VTDLVKPAYYPDRLNEIYLDDVLTSTPWVQVTDARLECFMAETDETYTYGSGRGVRTYIPVPPSKLVALIRARLNLSMFSYNVCFLNRYDNAHMQLGWHSDDSPGMNHEHPIAVISFGEKREIWWRPIGQTGVVPRDQRQMLEHGSIFIMPAGMQRTHQHRIPKGDREMGTRVSLTYRNYVPEAPWKQF
jgi:alkylated DNA repair dioxygenase AlkB